MGENFHECHGYAAVCESFLNPRNLGAGHPLAQQKGAICKSFLCENCLFHQFMNILSLESFPLYGTHGYNDPLIAFNLHTRPNSLSGGVVKLKSLVYEPVLMVTAAILYW